MTTALERGEGSALRPGRSLPPGKTRYPLYRRLGEYTLIIQHNFSSEINAKLTNKTGIKFFTSLLYLAALLPSKKQCLEELLDTDGNGSEQILLVMNRRSFKFLSQMHS